MDKAKAGSSSMFERTLINRVDRWSPVVPHPPENPFPFLVHQPLPYSLPLPKLVSPWTLYRRFSFLADSTTHERLLRRDNHLISLFASLPLSSPVCFPFISRELTSLPDHLHVFSRCRWCKCEEVHVVCFSYNTFFTFRLFTLYYVFSSSLFRPWPSNKLKEKSKLKDCICVFEWLRQKRLSYQFRH